MRKMIGIVLVTLFVAGLAGSALAEPTKKACKQSCQSQHKNLVDICRDEHDPIIRGKCMKIAAARLADCEKTCNDAAKQ